MCIRDRNRVYTEYYRARGYDFDITSTTRYDQAYVEGGDVFENISRIVDAVSYTHLDVYKRQEDGGDGEGQRRLAALGGVDVQGHRQGGGGGVQGVKRCV